MVPFINKVIIHTPISIWQQEKAK